MLVGVVERGGNEPHLGTAARHTNRSLDSSPLSELRTCFYFVPWTVVQSRITLLAFAAAPGALSSPLHSHQHKQA